MSVNVNALSNGYITPSHPRRRHAKLCHNTTPWYGKRSGGVTQLGTLLKTWTFAVTRPPVAFVMDPDRGKSSLFNAALKLHQPMRFQRDSLYRVRAGPKSDNRARRRGDHQSQYHLLFGGLRA